MIDAPSAPAPLSSAPGAKAAKLCGIWSIIASATCVGIPIGLVLAIIALVQQAKAKRLAKENPDFYELPTATGLVTGIIGLAMPVLMLPFIGIVSAIAIPALLSQRNNAHMAAMNAVFDQETQRAASLQGQDPMPPINDAAKALAQQPYRNPYTGQNVLPMIEEHPQQPGEIAIFVTSATSETGTPEPELVLRGAVKTSLTITESEARIPWTAPVWAPAKP